MRCLLYTFINPFVDANGLGVDVGAVTNFGGSPSLISGTFYTSSGKMYGVVTLTPVTAVTKTEYVDPVKKILGNDAVDGAKYGIYRSEDEASRDFNRLATVTCGCPESDLPEINLGNTHSYDLGSGNRLTAKFYIRQLTDTGMLAPDKKAYLFRMKPENKNDVPAGWVKLTS